MSLHGTPNDGHPLPGEECRECGQRVPVRFIDILRDQTERGFLTRRVKGYHWVRVVLRPLVWERPNHVPLVRGIVHRYGAGPFVVMVMPEEDGHKPSTK